MMIPATVFYAVCNLLTSLIGGSNMLFVDMTVAVVIFMFALLFSLRDVLRRLDCIVARILGLLSRCLPMRGGVVLKSALNADTAKLFIFVSTVLDTTFAVDLVQCGHVFVPSLLSVMLLIPYFVLMGALPSLIYLFVTVTDLVTLCVSGGAHGFEPSRNNIVTTVSFKAVLIIVTVLLTFGPVRGCRQFS